MIDESLALKNWESISWIPLKLELKILIIVLRFAWINLQRLEHIISEMDTFEKITSAPSAAIIKLGALRSKEMPWILVF